MSRVTRDELRSLIEAHPSDKDEIRHTEEAKVVAGNRVSECTPVAGARIDLTCQVCGERVCVGPTAVDLINKGRVLACFRCVEDVTGIDRDDFPEGAIHVHHRTYEHHGEEHLHLGDLVCLCSVCHKTFHDNGRLQK